MEGELISFSFRCIGDLLVSCHEFLVALDLLPILLRHIEHSEALAIMPVQVPVVHLMRPTDGADIGIVAPGKPSETLMNDHIMHEEVCDAIGHDPESQARLSDRCHSL